MFATRFMDLELLVKKVLTSLACFVLAFLLALDYTLSCKPLNAFDTLNASSDARDKDR